MRDADLLATVELIAAQEGFRQFPYLDTRGNETIGHGRNLKGKGIRRSEASLLLLDDIFDGVKHLTTTYPWFEKLDAVRQAALISMMMVGAESFDKYHRMTVYLAVGDYPNAATEADVIGWGPERNREVSDMIYTGRWPEKAGESMADAGEKAAEAAQVATEVLAVGAPGLGSILAAIAALIGGVEHALGKGHPTTEAASAHLAEAHKQIAAAMPPQAAKPAA
jgi:GH24 family phage-related lysozyme (muramidase)